MIVGYSTHTPQKQPSGSGSMELFFFNHFKPKLRRNSFATGETSGAIKLFYSDSIETNIHWLIRAQMVFKWPSNNGTHDD